MGLCEARRLADITVGDLVKAAGTARQTFYNHFSDINDLVCYAASFPLFGEGYACGDLSVARRACEQAIEHKAFFSQLAQHDGQNSFRATYNDWLKRKYYATFIDERMDASEKHRRRMAIDIWVVGSTEALLDWFASGMEAPLDCFMDALHDTLPAFMRDPSRRTPMDGEDYPR